jgi:hypothetical protein
MRPPTSEKRQKRTSLVVLLAFSGLHIWGVRKRARVRMPGHALSVASLAIVKSFWLVRLKTASAAVFLAVLYAKRGQTARP